MLVRYIRYDKYGNLKLRCLFIHLFVHAKQPTREQGLRAKGQTTLHR